MVNKIFAADSFKRCYKNLPEEIKSKLEKQEEIFKENPFHPSLHTEKLRPRGREVWSFHIDKRYRVIFRFEKDNVYLLFVGPHDKIYKIKF